jgi:segregation and condensation protein B
MTTHPPSSPVQDGNDAHDSPEEWTGEELEAAYQRALAALDSVDTEIIAVAPELQLAPDVVDPPANDSATSPAASPDEAADVPAEVLQQVTPQQVLEACLFVGGTPLTATRLAGLLRGNFTAQSVELLLDELNQCYQAEDRPYEIRLGEGGYRLVLSDSFARIQHKVYGLGPREVRLNQETLEVLALVAYRQPVTAEQLSEWGKPQSDATLRQLLRRDLIEVERSPDQPKDVRYRTTSRFLSLFGIGSLQELPRPEQLLYK